MLGHYSDVRVQAKRSALNALSTKRLDRDFREANGRVTTQCSVRTKADPSQVIETMVELVGIEPTTSSSNDNITG